MIPVTLTMPWREWMGGKFAAAASALKSRGGVRADPVVAVTLK